MTERYCKHCLWHGASEETIGDRVLDPSWRDDPEYQDWGSCPKCGLGTVEGAECRDCGTACPADDLHEDRCPECYVEWKESRIPDPHNPANSSRDTARKALWDIMDNLFYGGGK